MRSKCIITAVELVHVDLMFSLLILLLYRISISYRIAHSSIVRYPTLIEIVSICVCSSHYTRFFVCRYLTELDSRSMPFPFFCCSSHLVCSQFYFSFSLPSRSSDLGSLSKLFFLLPRYGTRLPFREDLSLVFPRRLPSNRDYNIISVIRTPRRF